MKKKQVKQKARGTVFSSGIYNFDIGIIINAETKDDIKRVFSKLGVKKDLADFWLDCPNLMGLLKSDAGTLVREGKLEIIYVFKNWVDDYKHLKILVHEVSHMVDTVAENRNIVHETEARAYLTEHLFSEIRDVLNKLNQTNK